MGDNDPLFELRNLFFVGNYQAAINEGGSLPKLNERQQLERDILVYRAQIAKGDHALVVNEIKDSAPNALQAVRCLATYMADEHDIALSTIKEWINDPALAHDDTIQLVAGIIYLNEGNYDDVFRSLQKTNSLEGHALVVQSYIHISRLDLAKKELAIMQEIDDDATMTQLALAWVNIAANGEKIEEAVAIFNELIEKWNATPLLLNGLAACYLHMSEEKENLKLAEKSLLQALEKNPNDTDTLINLIVCSQHMGKPRENINRYISQLKLRAPNHVWLKSQEYKEEAFDTCAARFSSSERE